MIFLVISEMILTILIWYFISFSKMLLLFLIVTKIFLLYLFISSCFLIAMKDDSIEGIYETLQTCAVISKNAGGIGLHVHNIRASGKF